MFQHRDRVHDELRTWTPADDLSEGEARDLALDALERIWADVDDLKWRLSIELPSDWRHRGGADTAEASVWLIFRRGRVRRIIAIPEKSRIGDLTHADLSSYLEQASCTNPDLLD